MDSSLNIFVLNLAEKLTVEGYDCAVVGNVIGIHSEIISKAICLETRWNGLKFAIRMTIPETKIVFLVFTPQEAINSIRDMCDFYFIIGYGESTDGGSYHEAEYKHESRVGQGLGDGVAKCLF